MSRPLDNGQALPVSPLEMSHSMWFSHHFHRAAGGDEALTVWRISLWLEKRVHSLFILHSCWTIHSVPPGLQRPQTGLPFSVKVTQHFFFPRNPLFGASCVTRENVSLFAAPGSSLGGLCPQRKHGFVWTVVLEPAQSRFGFCGAGCFSDVCKSARCARAAVQGPNVPEFTLKWLLARCV